MQVRTARDIGAAIRSRRQLLGWDQATLAQRCGVSRKWVIGIESGNAGAAIGLLLRACEVLDIKLMVSSGTVKSGKVRKSKKATPAIDLDRVLAQVRRPQK